MENKAEDDIGQGKAEDSKKLLSLYATGSKVSSAVKKSSIADFVCKDEHRPWLTGIYHENGMKKIVPLLAGKKSVEVRRETKKIRESGYQIQM